MQQVVRAAFVLVGLLSPVAALKVTTTAAAWAWLQAHSAPQQDELAELKDANPEAYAIVKALLTKRSLGLLNPRHPTASFAAPAATQDEEAAPSGATAFALSPEEQAKIDSTKNQADVYSAQPAASHHDWLNWKPQDSAMDDDAMVQNVLGAVAELKTPKKASLVTGGSALANDELAFSSDQAQKTVQADASPPAAPPAEPAATSPAEENSYLKGVDFGLRGSSSESVPAAANEGNSYLKGLDLVSKTTHDAGSSEANSLASFSWGDDAPAVANADSKPQQRLLQQKQAQASSQKQTAISPLSAWLSGKSPKTAKVTQVAPASTEAPASNPYTAGLW